MLGRFKYNKSWCINYTYCIHWDVIALWISSNSSRKHTAYGPANGRSVDLRKTIGAQCAQERAYTVNQHSSANPPNIVQNFHTAKPYFSLQTGFQHGRLLWFICGNSYTHADIVQTTRYIYVIYIFNIWNVMQCGQWRLSAYRLERANPHTAYRSAHLSPS